MKILKAFGTRLALFVELWQFMVARKKWWLAPLLIALAVVTLVLAISEIPVVAPFIYALF